MTDILSAIKFIAFAIVLVFGFLVFSKELRPLVEILVKWFVGTVSK